MFDTHDTRRSTLEGPLPLEVVEVLRGRESKRFPKCDLRAYYSAGWSYMVSTAGLQGDQPRDLALILPAPVAGTCVVQLAPCAAPELIAQLRAIFDEEVAP